ncbi:MAG: DHHW family protein [Nannocystaceae bacterium]
MATEKRALAPTPDLTPQGILNPGWGDSVEAYVADRFPLRSTFIDLRFWLEGLRGADVSEDALFLDVSFSTQLAESDWSRSADDLIAPPRPPAAQAIMTVSAAPTSSVISQTGRAVYASSDERTPERSPSQRSADATTPSPAPAAAAATTRPAAFDGGLIIYGSRAMQIFYGGASGSSSYVETLSEYEKQLRGLASVYALIAPTAGAFYIPERYRNRAKAEDPNINGTYRRLPSTVKKVDAYRELAKHTDESIYYRTDHHWSQLGAYYAYRAFCERAGLTPIELADMEQHSRGKWRGSLYSFSRTPQLKRVFDDLDYWVPSVGATATRYEGYPMSDGSRRPLFHKTAKSYRLFLGGDHPLLHIQSDSGSDRRVLLIKNSYGNAFAPFLIPHFADIFVVDYRSFEGSVLQLIKEQNVTDVIVLNGSFTSNSRTTMRRIKNLLFGKKFGARGPTVTSSPKENFHPSG